MYQPTLLGVDDTEPENTQFSHDWALVSQEVEACASESVYSLWSVESWNSTMEPVVCDPVMMCFSNQLFSR